MQLSVIISVLLPLVAFFNIGDCAISAWTNPGVANNGNGAITGTVDNGVTGASTGVTVAATSGATITGYAVTSTPPGVTFTISTAGLISVSAGTINYATATKYVLIIIATDDDSASTATCTGTLAVNDAPVFDPTTYSYCMNETTASGDAIATVTAINVVGTMAYAIVPASNTNTDFAVVGTTGVITAANDLASATTAKYELEYTGADGSLTATTTITIMVGTCSGASAILASFITILLALFATLK